MNTTRSNKALKILIVVLCTVFCTVPSRVLANTPLASPFLGVNVNIIDVGVERASTNIGTINFTPNSNVMTVSGQLTCREYYTDTGGCKVYQSGTPTNNKLTITTNLSANITSNTGLSTSYDATYIIEYEFILDNYYIGTFVVDGTTIFVNGTSVSVTSGPYSDLPSTTSISIDSYDLELLDSNKMYWQFPFESYPYIQYLYNQGFEQVGIDNSNNALYPIFQKKTDGYIDRNTVGSGVEHIIVMFSSNSVSGQNGFNTHFKYNSNFTISSYENLRATVAGYLIKVTFKNTGTGNQTLDLQCNNSNGKFTVIFYSNKRSYYNVSDDFALMYGLNNGTADTYQSTSALDQEKQTFDDTVSGYHDLESGFVDDFDSSVSDLPSFNVGTGFGSTFLTSTQWVKQQFDRVTIGTPFGSYLSFTLVLGFALLIIGKVHK